MVSDKVYTGHSNLEPLHTNQVTSTIEDRWFIILDIFCEDDTLMQNQVCRA